MPDPGYHVHVQYAAPDGSFAGNALFMDRDSASKSPSPNPSVTVHGNFECTNPSCFTLYGIGSALSELVALQRAQMQAMMQPRIPALDLSSLRG